MLLHIPEVLSVEQEEEVLHLLETAEWIDGRVTAGHQSAQAKDNMQIRESTPLALQLGEMVIAALQQNALFTTAALPFRVFPPLFNCYRSGQSFGTHVD